MIINVVFKCCLHLRIHAAVGRSVWHCVKQDYPEKRALSLIIQIQMKNQDKGFAVFIALAQGCHPA